MEYRRGKLKIGDFLFWPCRYHALPSLAHIFSRIAGNFRRPIDVNLRKYVHFKWKFKLRAEFQRTKFRWSHFSIRFSYVIWTESPVGFQLSLEVTHRTLTWTFLWKKRIYQSSVIRGAANYRLCNLNTNTVYKSTIHRHHFAYDNVTMLVSGYAGYVRIWPDVSIFEMTARSDFYVASGFSVPLKMVKIRADGNKKFAFSAQICKIPPQCVKKRVLGGWRPFFPKKLYIMGDKT